MSEDTPIYTAQELEQMQKDLNVKRAQLTLVKLDELEMAFATHDVTAMTTELSEIAAQLPASTTASQIQSIVSALNGLTAHITYERSRATATVTGEPMMPVAPPPVAPMPSPTPPMQPVAG